jgi:transglutaminase-like putative cysteine protease
VQTSTFSLLFKKAPSELTFPPLSPPGALQRFHFGSTCQSAQKPNLLSGSSLKLAPMDFSGWFQVYLSGQWYTFDARHNVPRAGRILMGTGRDAADVALTTSFGRMDLVKFFVISDEVVPA